MGGIDAELVRRVDSLPRVSFAGAGFRHLGPGHSPTSGEGARIRGGRWNPEDSFPVLYMALSPNAVVAEFFRLVERQGMSAENLLPRRFQEYAVELCELLDIREEDPRGLLGLTAAIIAGDDSTRCQAVGDAAHYASFEGILAPSATGAGAVLAIFTGNLVAGSSIEVGRSHLWTTLPT